MIIDWFFRFFGNEPPAINFDIFTGEGLNQCGRGGCTAESVCAACGRCAFHCACGCNTGEMVVADYDNPT